MARNSPNSTQKYKLIIFSLITALQERIFPPCPPARGYHPLDQTAELETCPAHCAGPTFYVYFFVRNLGANCAKVAQLKEKKKEKI
jgi:hypothetical protein